MNFICLLIAPAPRPSGRSSAEQLQLCIEVIACHVIGGEHSYMKNFKSQTAAEQVEAQRLTAAWNWLLGVEGEIAQDIMDIRVLGRCKLASLLQAVLDLPNPDFGTADNWHMCSITGAVSAQTVAIPAAAAPSTDTRQPAPCHVDAHFYPFVTALWISAHVHALERNRMLVYASK